ncbi:c-5 sterol desaturase [Pleurotus pulmonarius]|nr:c-5 sterol desaturase [Pleurotus pulmonarius]
MDLILEVCDYLFLDRVWASLVPVSAFASSAQTFQTLNSSTILPAVGPSSTWSHFVSKLPHPPLPFEEMKTVYTSAPQVSAWPRNYIPRQILSILTLTYIGIHVLYFLFAWLSYRFVFNHEMMKHPRFLKNQVKLEIQSSLKAFPGMILLTLPWFQGEVMGYSRLYDDVEEYGWGFLVASVPLYLLFTDYLIYWIHRGLHHPFVYKNVHKPHHKWLIPTPFASHAFHPLDGYLQSIPYHLYIYLFPLHRILHLVLFVLVNIWSIFIHDSDMITGHALEKIINGPAHHTLHHLYFTVNYGQYFTWADRWSGSYRQPESSLDPLLEVKALNAAKEKEALGKAQ